MAHKHKQAKVKDQSPGNANKPGMTKLKRLSIPNVGEDAEQLDHCWWKVKWYDYFGNNCSFL